MNNRGCDPAPPPEREKDMYFRRSRDAIKYAEKHYEDWSIWFDQQMQMFYIIGKMRKENTI